MSKRKSEQLRDWPEEMRTDVKPEHYPGEIAKLRQRHLRVSQSEFARLLGVSHAAVSGWERGKFPPSAEVCIRLGNLAPYPESVWWWQLAGVDPEHIFATFTGFLSRKDAQIAARTQPDPAWDVSMKTAAKILQLSDGEVKRLVKTGDLKARQFRKGGPFFVDGASIALFEFHRGTKKKRGVRGKG